MNEDKMIEVLSQIEFEREGVSTNNSRTPVGFNMNTWLSVPRNMAGDPINVCGTTACLAGHAMLADGWSIDFQSGVFYKGSSSTGDAEDDGAAILGITPEEANNLFYLDDLDSVYRWVADRMGIDEQVLREKVRDYR